MSTDYEIRCACGDRFARDNWRSPTEVAALLGLRAHLAAIGKSADVALLDGWDAWGSMLPSAFRFFAEHEGHEMSVFDEYGRKWTPEYDRRRRALYAELGTPGADVTMLHAQLSDLNLEMEAP
jgi:hypothetical protein